MAQKVSCNEESLQMFYGGRMEIILLHLIWSSVSNVYRISSVIRQSFFLPKQSQRSRSILQDGKTDLDLWDRFYSILFYPITLEGRWGTTDEFATTPFHLDLFSAALVELAKSIFCPLFDIVFPPLLLSASFSFSFHCAL